MTNMTKRRELNEKERAAAANLKMLWDIKKDVMAAAGRKLTQEDAAQALDITQGAISHFLKGRLPLNIDALVKFSKFLDVHPAEIFPSMWREVESAVPTGAVPENNFEQLIAELESALHSDAKEKDDRIVDPTWLAQFMVWASRRTDLVKSLTPSQAIDGLLKCLSEPLNHESIEVREGVGQLLLAFTRNPSNSDKISASIKALLRDDIGSDDYKEFPEPIPTTMVHDFEPPPPSPPPDSVARPPKGRKSHPRDGRKGD